MTKPIFVSSIKFTICQSRVENLSYGAVATSPITEERNGKKYIIGTNIPVISTKVGSTDCHNNEYYLREDLFTEEEMKYILTEKPLMFVVDASDSVSNPERTSEHIPDGFKGYRNEFIAINYALSGKVEIQDFYEDDEFWDGLSQNPFFKNDVSKIKKLNLSPEDKRPYKFHFDYPGNKELGLRVGKEVDTIASKLKGASEIEGPAVIFYQAAIEPEAVPQYIGENFIKGRHGPAHFDDEDHFKRFYLNFKDGYGVVPSKETIKLSRRYFRELMELLGESIPTAPTDSGSNIFDDSTVEEPDDGLKSGGFRRILNGVRRALKIGI